MHKVQLDRFRLDGFLGSGSDYEAHAATDLQTGEAVVLKRPNPDYITRQFHGGIDLLSQRLVEVHSSIGTSISRISRLVGYAEGGSHDGYFGDSLKQQYWVLVYQRARGIPLAADIRDKFRGVPTGLPQGLFAIHPLAHHAARAPFDILRQLMEVEEALLDAGYLLLDTRPQNVYYDPLAGDISIIDIGAMPAKGTASQGAVSIGDGDKDFHDFFAEVFRFYAVPDIPPADIAGYREPVGMRNVPQFELQVKGMLGAFSTAPDARVRDAAVGVLERVLERSYPSVDAFRSDLEAYLTAVEERNRGLHDLPERTGVWREGLAMLSQDYWRKFLFDPETDLASYGP
jgi:hypothetical protein